MFKILKNNEGLTLVELLVAMSILLLVLSAAYSFLSLGNSSYTRGADRFNTQSTLRIAADYITNEIRFATSLNVLNSITATNLNDVLETSAVLEYKKYGDTNFRYIYIDKNNQLTSLNNGVTQKIGDPSLNSLEVVLGSFIETQYLDFKITGDQEYTIESTVKMLNRGEVVDLIERFRGSNLFWYEFLTELHTGTGLRRNDYVIDSRFEVQSDELQLTIAGEGNPNGGAHVFKRIEPRHFSDGASTILYKIVVDAQIREGSGYGILLNGTLNQAADNLDSGYMFQFDPGANGFLIRLMNNGTHNPSVHHGVSNIYRPADIVNNQFKNFNFYNRYKTEITVQEVRHANSNSDRMYVKVVIIDMEGNRSNPMYFGFQLFHPLNQMGRGEYIGIRTWQRQGNSFDTLFYEIKLEPALPIK